MQPPVRILGLCLSMLGTLAVWAHEGGEHDPSVGLCPAVSPDDPCTQATCGEWSQLPGELPFSPAHAALLRNGWLLFMPETYAIQYPDVRTMIWNPSTNERRFTGNVPDPLLTVFCSGHVFLNDGRLLAVGGGSPVPEQTTRKAWIFDPQDPDTQMNGWWTDTCAGCQGAQCDSCQMRFPRYYPTLLTLTSPYVLVASGWCDPDDESAGCVEDEVYGGYYYPPRMEVFDATSNTFQEVLSPPGEPTAADSCPTGGLPCRMAGTYPGLHRTPNGRLLFTRTAFGHGSPEPGNKSAYFEFTALGPVNKRGRWVDMTPMTYPDRSEGMSVDVFRRLVVGGLSNWQHRVLVFGGGRHEDTGCGTTSCIDNRKSVEWIEANNLGATSSWNLLGAQMRDPRLHATAVTLPTGKILVFGGNEIGEETANPCPNRSAELFDPAHLDNPSTPAFSYAGRMPEARGYHVVASLLPSGAVMVTSGVDDQITCPTPCPGRIIDIYKPPYFFQGPRPTISAAPSTLTRGQPFSLTSPEAASITKVVFARPMSFTHHTDPEQRVLEVPFVRSGSELTVTIPVATAPILNDGYWMLFVIDGSGRPSEAKFFRLL